MLLGICFVYVTEPLAQDYGYRQIKTKSYHYYNWAASSEKFLRTCIKCADSDHPSHAQSISRAFSFHSYIL